MPLRFAMVATRPACAVACLSVGLPAAGQTVNPGFETGSFAPWAVTPTPNGRTIFQNVTAVDIDGPGPRAASPAAHFMVGANTQGQTGGIELAQDVNLRGETRYDISLDLAVIPLYNAHNQSGGLFELLVDGVTIATYTSPQVSYLLVPDYARLTAAFTTGAPGSYEVAVRITRPVPAGEEVFQYVDNFVVEIACYPDCTASTGQGVLDIFDFLCFQDLFLAGEPYACDCDTSTGGGVCDIFDFLCFQDAFLAGCP